MACTVSTALRVVDASAMRYVTNGNIYAPVMMLAEKSADLILGNTPLAPEPVEGYYAISAPTHCPADPGSAGPRISRRLDAHSSGAMSCAWQSVGSSGAASRQSSKGGHGWR